MDRQMDRWMRTPYLTGRCAVIDVSLGSGYLAWRGTGTHTDGTDEMDGWMDGRVFRVSVQLRPTCICPQPSSITSTEYSERQTDTTRRNATQFVTLSGYVCFVDWIMTRCAAWWSSTQWCSSVWPSSWPRDTTGWAGRLCWVAVGADSRHAHLTHFAYTCEFCVWVWCWCWCGVCS